MESIVVDYLTSILVFSVLSFITLFGILFILLYCHLNCPCDSKDENKQDKNVVDVDKIECRRVSTGKNFASVYFCDFLKDKIVELSNDIRDDLSLHQDCILELNDRLNLIEIEIKNIKKVGKKNGSKK